MKKFLSLLVVTAMVASLAACGPASTTTEPTKAPSNSSSENKSNTEAKATAAPELIKAYTANAFTSATAKASSISTADGGLTVPGDGWLFFANVDFGTRGANGLTTHVIVPEAADGGQILMYIDGSSDGNVSDATLCATIDLYKSTIDTWCKRLANLDPSITDVHNVTFVFKANANVTVKDFEFHKAAHMQLRSIDYVEPTTPCTLENAKEAVGGWNGRLYQDISMNNTTLSLGGDTPTTGYTFEHGISMNAVGHLVYDIPEDAKKFVAIVGIDDSAYGNSAQHNQASVKYSFSVDGIVVYATAVLGNGEYEMIDIPLEKGDQELRIDIGDGGNGITCDNASICEPGFVE